MPVRSISSSDDSVVFHLKDVSCLNDSNGYFNSFSDYYVLSSLEQPDTRSISKRSSPIRLSNPNSQEDADYITQMEMELECKTYEMYSMIKKHSPSKDMEQSVDLQRLMEETDKLSLTGTDHEDEYFVGYEEASTSVQDDDESNKEGEAEDEEEHVFDLEL